MKRKQITALFWGIIILLMSSACERERTGCDFDEANPKPALQLDDLISQPPHPKTSHSPSEVEIKGKVTQVDMLVDYPICNDNWSGIVYVNCEAQVADAELDDRDNPLFFKGCDLTIEPNTVVYVAAHNDAAYYKGCSCHTGEDPIP